LWRVILEREELYSRIVSVVRSFFGSELEAVIVFGSYIYMGGGRDIDLIIVVKEKPTKNKIELEYKIKRLLEDSIPGAVFDIHILSIDEFRDNLSPGTVLAGLALGYEAIFGENLVEPLILDFLEKLTSERYVLHNRYGSWSIAHHAKLLLKIKKKHEEEKTPIGNCS